MLFVFKQIYKQKTGKYKLYAKNVNHLEQLK
jgi:hypothetical protein